MYILNTKYKLKNDIERILLISEQHYGSQLYISFVHPVYAWILNQFDGKTTIKEIIDGIKNVLGLRDFEIEKVLAPLINNPKEIAIQYDDVISTFPPFILVDNTENRVRKKYKDVFFAAIKRVNHSRNRLFKPINLLICPTLKCFTDCVYCYANRYYKHEELDSDIWVKFINQAKHFGVEQIDVTGGEFFLKKGWKDIAKCLTCNGYFPDISTKIPLSHSTLEDIKLVGLRSLQFSIDTLSPSIAANTLNVDSQYISKLKDTITYAGEIGLKLILKPTLTKYTCSTNNVRSILEFADSLENMEKVVVSVIGRSCYKPQGLYMKIRPSLRQIEEVRSLLKGCSKEFLYPIQDDTFVYRSSEMRNDKIFEDRARCTANVEGFVILPDGTATICEELYWNEKFIIGNITNETIPQIWMSPNALKLAFLVTKDIPIYSNCRLCEQLVECHRKRGVCWKLIMSAYGMKYVFNPDPRCPKAPIPNMLFTVD